MLRVGYPATLPFELFRDFPKGIELIPVSDKMDRDVEIDVWIPDPYSTRAIRAWPRLRGVKLVLAMMAGTEWVPETVGPHVTICNAHGAHNISTAEWTVAAILTMLKYFSLYLDIQRAGAWRRRIEASSHYAKITGDTSTVYPPVLQEELTGKTVLLVDANLRLPYLHSVFHCDGKLGLADVLHNGADLRSCVRPTEVQNLSLMTAGAVGEDGLAWVQTARFVQFVRTACESFDHVILDSTSTIGVADARIIACSVDAVIYVVQAGRLNSTLVLRGVENLRQVQAKILGVVLNNAWYTKGDNYYFRKRALISPTNGALRRQADDKPSESDGEGNGKT